MLELKGLPVVNKLIEDFAAKIKILKENNIIAKLAVVRVGERDEDISYEKSILKRLSAVNTNNIKAETIVLPSDVSQTELEETIILLNRDDSVHGIILFRPLPEHLSQERIKFIISEEKDVDCMGISNTAYLFEGKENCYAPCTPQAVIETLDYYGIDVSGKKTAIIGRSLVVGKPLAMLLLAKNATVTICHTKTSNLADECRRADILIACAGVPKMITSGFINPNRNQIIIDVGINMADGRICGDVDYDSVADTVKAITPVPGGIGTVTTSVLLKHTLNSAVKKYLNKK